jgi:Complex I intermediate-associated protein 30 (CIA30)/ParB-like nuclease domain
MNDEVKLIPIEKIRILNPRHRDQKRFEQIVQSIKNLGLKVPIQVSIRSDSEPEGSGYDLICGQGRIEAFIALGHKEIPAIVVEISKEERLIRSLVENIARRYPQWSWIFRAMSRPGFDAPLYQCGFVTKRNEWEEHRLAFKDFLPTFRGHVLGDVPPLNPANIVAVGLLIADKQEGSFRLEICWIKALP